MLVMMMIITRVLMITMMMTMMISVCLSTYDNDMFCSYQSSPLRITNKAAAAGWQTAGDIVGARSRLRLAARQCRR